MVKFKDFEGGVDAPMMDDAGGVSVETKNGWGKWVATAVGIIVVAAVLWFVYQWFLGGASFLGGSEKYQAVFLDNNQVYFGKLSDDAAQYAVLQDIYYLRLTQPLQPPAPGQANLLPDVNLIKLGTELHGPEDEMRINRDHILFVEDLKEDGTVVKAIRSFQEFQKQQQ